MKVRLVESESELTAFFSRQEQTPFLQSWGWGEVQRRLGRDIIRLVVVDGPIVAVALVVRQPLPASRAILYSPRGPVFVSGVSLERQREILTDIELWLKHQPIGQGAVAWRIEPVLPAPMVGRRTIDSQPPRTSLLDLRHSEDELLKAMHQKTRYNIRLAEKKGLTVEQRTDPAALDIFWQLTQATTARDKFRPHGKSHYMAILDVLGGNELQNHGTTSVILYVASHNGQPLAANMVVSYGDTVTYLHGASSDEKRELMAPYLAQWRAIQDAKKAGYHWYDFHGIAPENEPNHAWVGITRFKNGFGGQAIDFAGTFDIPLSKGWYKAYQALRRVRRSV